jgi:imidazolonepropionase-like amidohydrolase
MSTENTTDQEVDKVAEQAVEEATDNAVELTPEQSNAVNFMANKFLNNVRLSEALSVVTLNQLLQLVQQQVVSQATAEVEQMTDEQLKELLAEAEEFNKTLS